MTRFIAPASLLLLAAPAVAATNAQLLAWAGSNSTPELRQLARQLSRPEVVQKLLDVDRASRKVARCGLGAPPYSARARCRNTPDLDHRPLASVLCAMAANPAARATLVSLTRTRAFAQDTDPGDALLEATTLVERPSAQMVKLWRRWSAPDSATSNLMDTVLLENGSAPAIALMRALFRSPRYERERKQGWVVTIYVHRAHPSTLELARRLLDDRLPAALQLDLIRAAFETRPTRMGYSPKPWKDTPSPTRAALLALGRRALRVKRLPPALKSRIEQTLTEVADRPSPP